MNKVFIGVIIALSLATAFLLQRTITLSHRMQEAVETIKLFEIDKQISNQALKNQQEAEHAIQEARKLREKDLEAAACLTGDEHVNYLLRLLDEDFQARCGKAPGDAAR